MECTGPGPGGPQEPGTGGGLRLFVFPHAGGWSLMFQDWPDHFPPDWRVRALDAPGHGPLLDTPPLTDGEALVAHFLDLLTPEITDDRTPFAFFGHSMGSLVAYELTRRLLAEGLTLPVWLGISAFSVPQPGDETAPLLDSALSDDALRHRLAALGGTPAPVLADPYLWTVFAPAIRADLAVLRGLRTAPAGAPLPVALSAFAGARDRAAPPARIAPWADRTEHFLGLRVFSGGHFYFQDDLAALAAQVTADVHTALRARAAVAGAR
ncbi:thioesterase II family protein [Streptomyces albicerus]|jgi:surfactin synthase thioesterase subunit|uniref:thioesterase II family protein n=1 Tax=Streptomyces albicerus TaxID=2569859 RepID=UPI00124B9C33|nr:alpha/beta fold hydrolase [Streptomyces albicerus]